MVWNGYGIYFTPNVGRLDHYSWIAMPIFDLECFPLRLEYLTLHFLWRIMPERTDIISIPPMKNNRKWQLLWVLCLPLSQVISLHTVQFIVTLELHGQAIHIDMLISETVPCREVKFFPNCDSRAQKSIRLLKIHKSHQRRVICR